MQPRNVTGRARRIILTLVMVALAGLVVWLLVRPAPPTVLCDDVRASGRPGCTPTGTTTP